MTWTQGIKQGHFKQRKILCWFAVRLVLESKWHKDLCLLCLQTGIQSMPAWQLGYKAIQAFLYIDQASQRPCWRCPMYMDDWTRDDGCVYLACAHLLQCSCCTIK